MKATWIVWIIVAALIAAIGGCAFHVQPPPNVQDPVTVFLSDYGYHAGLLIPRDERRLAEFAYGEWEWFARGNNAWYRAGPVLFWPSPGALGTRTVEFGTPPDVAAVRAATGAGDALAIRVERGDAERLLTQLDAAFRADEAGAVLNPAFGMLFVPDRRRYSLANHCNTVTAAWLRELGCRVSGSAYTADFRLKE